jgi:hypothetical protein
MTPPCAGLVVLCHGVRDDQHPRGIEYPPLFTLPARLRFTLMAALAQFLLGPRSTDYYEPAPNSMNQFYPLRPMTLSPAVWEFFRARFASWPICLRERVSSAFEQMAHAPLRQISPERHHRFSFLRTQFSELSTTGPPYFLPLRTIKRARARVSRI